MHYDLTIIGGGLVGAGLAIALADSGLRIAVVDASKHVSDDPRLFALSETTCQFLTNIHVWQQIVMHAAPIKSVHVSCKKSFGALRLTSEDVALKQLGNVIPAHYLENALKEKLAQLTNITLYQPARLSDIATDGMEASLTIETLRPFDPSTLRQAQGSGLMAQGSGHGIKNITSSIVCAADGAESSVRQQLNIPTDVVDYEQTAIVTRTLLTQPHHNIAYERFTSDGAIAMLPLIGNECATIWSLTNANANHFMALSDHEFIQKLQQAFGTRLGKFAKITKRYSYPLRMIKAKESYFKNVFLIGNAAHTLHPIAAQGFNLSLYEVAVFAETVLEKIKENHQISPEDLACIAQKIQKQQQASISTSHRLASMLTKYRGLSLRMLPLIFSGLNIVTPLKKNILLQLLSLQGRVPKLLLKNEL